MKQMKHTRALALLLVVALAVSLFGYAKEKSRGEQDYDRMVAAGKFFFEHYLDTNMTGDPIKNWLVTMFEKDETLADQMINLMYQTWDPYSYYMKNEVHDTAFDTSRARVGIGINIKENEAGAVMISAVTVGGPADTAGLKVGDIIQAVDGRSVDGYSVSMVGDLLRGEVGGKVSVRVLRDGKQQTFSVTHALMRASTVSAVNHGGGVAYISISGFNGTETFMDFTTLYETLADEGIRTVMLDLRNNPGGSLDCVINMLNYIIPEEGVPYLRQRYAAPSKLRTMVSDGLGWMDNKMLILTNENTVSAAEILAGVLQDLGYAEIVGTKTYAKGYAQLHHDIDADHTAVISFCEILLPKRGSFDGVGILPDHPVNLYTTSYKMPALSPLNLNVGISAGTTSNVRAVEERLHELGYFEFTPDDTADFRTWHAVGQFQKNNELPQTDRSCDVKTVQAIDAAMKTLAETPVVIDTQFQKALMLARAYTARSEQPTPTPMEELNFGQ